MRSRAFTVVGLAASAFLGSCGSSTPTSTITVAVTPATATLSPGASTQFTATVTGATNTAVTWQVNGTPGGSTAAGTISSNGLYTAPSTIPKPATVTVTAISSENASVSGSASVTIAQQVPVAVTPNPISIAIFTTQQFAATVNGQSSTAVTWEVNGVTGGSQATGFISASGLFVAPSGVPTASSGNGTVTTTTVTVTAVSTASPNSSGSATVTIFPPNQNPQTGAIEFGTSGGNQNDSTTSGNKVTCCGGTLGSLVTRGGTQYILSNNHVLARTDLAAIGESIVQPGLVDTNCGQTASSTVGQLSQFYNLETGTAPKIDAAIAQAVTGAVNATGNILFLGATVDANNVPMAGAPHSGSGVTASVNMAVAKSGRSTGLTCSTIMVTGVTATVQYQKGCGTGTMFSETFTNQVDIAGGSFSAPGDSGSLIVTQNTADPVALLFAGSDTDSVGNPVSDVLAFFQSGGNAATFVGGATHQVIGCTLPVKPASATLTVPTSTASPEGLKNAIAARDAHAPELLAYPGVQAVGVGTSYDNPAEAAILLFVSKGQPRRNLPAVVDGVRTRIVEGELFSERGVLSPEESATLEQSAAPPQLVYSISDAEVARAKIVHRAHVDELMNMAGVQGVGITSSADSPGQAALMIFLIRGVAHPAIPPVIDGLRTRVRESSRFRAGFADSQPKRGCSVSSPGKKPEKQPPKPQTERWPGNRGGQLPPPALSSYSPFLPLRVGVESAQNRAEFAPSAVLDLSGGCYASDNLRRKCSAALCSSLPQTKLHSG
ncbi:MAG TPA: hypothetical protein VHM93_10430 [Candidatus Acidoferrum sp.]|nr:hypothetical protein [Candidatus Acidoferrum sp.]